MYFGLFLYDLKDNYIKQEVLIYSDEHIMFKILICDNNNVTKGTQLHNILCL